MNDYRKLIEAFSEEIGYSEKQKSYLLRSVVYTKELYNLKPYQYGQLVIEDMCGALKNKVKSARYLQENYLYISAFMDWSVSKGYIPYNPYKEVNTLHYEHLWRQMSEQTNLQVIYREDLLKIVSSIEYNRPFYSVILGLLFDGVKSYKELASVKLTNFDSSFLNIGKRVIPLSGFTLEALEEYKRMIFFYNEKSSALEKLEYFDFQNYLIKITNKFSKVIETDNENQYISSIAKSIGIHMESIGIPLLSITRSALISALRVEFSELSDMEFCNLFISNKKKCKEETSRIKKVIKIYGKSRPDEVIKACIPYIIRSIYYL